MRKLNIPLRQYAALLSAYLRPQWKSITLLLLLLLLSIGMQLINPQIIRSFIDMAKEQADSTKLIYAAVLFIGVSLLYQAIMLAATYLGENIGWIATNKLRGDVAEHCLRLDMSFHKAHTSGSLIERVDGDINALANFFSKLVVTLLSNLVLVAGIIILLFREGWEIGLGMLVFTVFAIWSIQYIRRYASPFWGKMRQISADFYGFLGEQLDGTEDVRANGASGFVLSRFDDLLRKWLPIRIRAFFGFAAMWITTIVVFAMGNAMAFAVSAYLWKKGSLTIGAVYMIFYYTELLAKPIEQIRTQMEDLQKADASITRIKELLELRPAVTDGRGTSIPAGPVRVKFDRMTFGYEPGSVTLDSIHFELKPGESLGVLGRTGSGKSTLARLLLRFYDPASGGIYLNGVNIRDAKLAELRRSVGMVTQQIELFQGTVRDNLTFFDESIPDSRIIGVLEELGMGEWLHSMPLGLDSPLESSGGGLSAGEAQLMAFARVFLMDPGLVILDEASSRLDPATEQRIESAISKLLRNRTSIIIAHRLATVQRVDQILVLDNGRVVEYGERSRLAADRHTRFSGILEKGLEETPA
ncbi:ABC transporter ATP-binding protein [Paenibacillus aurantius]|uniref:ABC transporter ATP-binding protein n=1 Tax=Paenibacillus aurantius TaxID=2918900 RepID=A0AA96RHX8_9BACL|nr:ABC transporter ATP-binding protein [Paenibacillus aurantius]WNQ13873.1 ABC transporter ATP-binding protein [Paenibacillus aurantius]